MSKERLSAWAEEELRTNAEVNPSSQTIAKPNVSRSKCDYHAVFTFCGDNGITYCSNCGEAV